MGLQTILPIFWKNFISFSLMYPNQNKSLFQPFKTNRRNSASGGSSSSDIKGPKRPRPTQPRRGKWTNQVEEHQWLTLIAPKVFQFSLYQHNLFLNKFHSNMEYTQKYFIHRQL